MTTEVAEQRAGIAFGGVVPVLRVRSVRRSIDYYTRALGFKVEFATPDGAEPNFASVARGRCNLFLCQGDQGHSGSWIWIDGVDIEQVYQEYQASGAVIRNPPTNYSWALEMQVEDPDGNVLRIGSEPKPNEPMGEWVDMNGVRWTPQLDGGWKRKENEGAKSHE